MKLFENLSYDLNRVMENDPAARSKIEVFLLYPTINALISYRIAHYLYTKKLFFLARLISQISRFFYRYRNTSRSKNRKRISY